MPSTPNAELFRKIHEQITTHPEQHEQHDWVSFDECGTTHCVGGWAIHFQNPKQSIYQTAIDLRPDDPALSRVAEDLLGLDYHQAYQLFYDATNEQAVALCAYYGGLREDFPLDDEDYADDIDEEVY